MHMDDAAPQGKTPHIAVILPAPMDVRSVLETPVLHEFAQRSDVQVTFLSTNEADQQRIAELGKPHLRWAHIWYPVAASARSRFWQQQIRRIKRHLYLLLRAEFGNLVFRFNHLHQFATHRYKVHLTSERKKLEDSANFIASHWGKPFPKSWALFRLAYALYYAPWDRDSLIEAFFEQLHPDLVVTFNAQHPAMKWYSTATRQRAVPLVGVVSSWDRLTIKGALCPGIQRYVVQSQIMHQDLKQYHNVADKQIDVVGWWQMDCYKQPAILLSREAFLRSIGLPPSRRLLVFAAYTLRLGQHEPAIVQHIARKVQEGAYGDHCTLLVRPHPMDSQWQERFGALHAVPDVIVQPAEKGRLDYLANLLYHADIFLASQGSISLDAIAMHTCVINIGFDGDLEADFYGSVRRYYEMDHYAPVVASGAVRLVDSYADLDQAILEYLRNPDANCAQREQLRRKLLEPFDGQASRRLVNRIVDAAFTCVQNKT
jgi:hypothetical protein